MNIFVFTVALMTTIALVNAKEALRAGGSPRNLEVPPKKHLQQLNTGDEAIILESRPISVKAALIKILCVNFYMQQRVDEVEARQEESVVIRDYRIPTDWKSMGFFDIREHFNCEPYSNDQNKPLPSIEDWHFFQNGYKMIVDENAIFDDPVPPTLGYSLAEGVPTPFYAAQSTDGRGRGLFASRFIKKGDLVHDGNRSDFIFPSGMSWRRYIFSMPRDKACDMIEWTWTQRTELNGKYKIFAAPNISVLLNAELEEHINVMPESDISSKMYATRDIQVGDELLTDYDVYETVWEEVGL